MAVLELDSISKHFGAIEALRDEAPEPPAVMKDLVLNLTVVGGPDGDRDMHLNSGQFERGHAEGAPTKLTVPYDVAKDLFIEEYVTDLTDSTDPNLEINIFVQPKE